MFVRRGSLQLTATNSLYEFDFVIILQLIIGIFATWHDVMINFYRKAFVLKAELTNQLFEAGWFTDYAVFAVDYDFHGPEIVHDYTISKETANCHFGVFYADLEKIRESCAIYYFYRYLRGLLAGDLTFLGHFLRIWENNDF